MLLSISSFTSASDGFNLELESREGGGRVVLAGLMHGSAEFLGKLRVGAYHFEENARTEQAIE